MKNLLLRIVVRHSFYKDPAAHGIRLEACESTQQFLSRYSLQLHAHNGDFVLYHLGSDFSWQSLRCALPDLLDGECLQFKLLSSDENFHCITELPLQHLGELHYSSSDSSKNEDGSLQLQPGFSSCSTAPNCIAQVEIEAQMLTANTAPSFRIQFSSRKTRWHYFIISRTGKKTGRLSITSEEFDFEDLGSKTLPDGEKAQHFSSGERLLPLQQVYSQALQLEEELQTPAQPGSVQPLRKRSILKKLPTPGCDRITTDKTTGSEAACSIIYVHI